MVYDLGRDSELAVSSLIGVMLSEDRMEKSNLRVEGRSGGGERAES
jgi:hypothetical protein